MTSFFASSFLSLCIIIPAITGVYRFRQMDKTFLPFMLFIWFGLANELLSLVFCYKVGSNAVNSNIYLLLEYSLLIYLFYRWGNSTAKPYIFFAVLGVLVWMADNLFLHAVTERNSLFRIFYSFVIIFFSIDRVNKLIVYERRSLLKNPVFIVCLSFLMYYSCKAFVEVFVAFFLDPAYGFNEGIYMILIVSNFISNILYTIAIACIPPKLEFTLPY